MGLWVNFLSLAVAAIVLGDRQASSFPAKPVGYPLMLMNAYGNPMVLMRATREPEPIHPQRAMMLTGFYHPVRRTVGSQASGVFAQGNAVSGGAYFGGKNPNYLQRNSEEEISSAEAEAAPALQDHPNEYGGDFNYPPPTFNQADQPGLEQNPTLNDDPVNFSTEAPVEVENPTTASTRPPKVFQPVKKNKKTTKRVEESEDDPANKEEEEEEDDDDDEEVFAPLKPKRRGNMPSFNNFFPMVFSLPKSYGRRTSSGSPPGMITAIANSYSTGKGGVASSVATAYGGSPNGKKKRDYSIE